MICCAINEVVIKESKLHKHLSSTKTELCHDKLTLNSQATSKTGTQRCTLRYEMASAARAPFPATITCQTNPGFEHGLEGKHSSPPTATKTPWNLACLPWTSYTIQKLLANSMGLLSCIDLWPQLLDDNNVLRIWLKNLATRLHLPPVFCMNANCLPCFLLSATKSSHLEMLAVFCLAGEAAYWKGKDLEGERLTGTESWPVHILCIYYSSKTCSPVKKMQQ